MKQTMVAWQWDGRTIPTGIEMRGERPGVLLLPAPSSISTRAEMRPLASALPQALELASVDWPAFGEAAKPAIRWSPAAFASFLEHALSELTEVRAIVAAGHSAAYALDYVARHPGRIERLALLAPTWRGPLRTMAGGDRPIFGRIRRAVERPVLGPLLYRLNVNPAMTRMMVAGHVYRERRGLSPEQRRVIAAPGARFGSGAFVTGGLDLVESRETFLDLARRAAVPILLVYGRDVPPKSRAEMMALGELPGVTTRLLERGKLSAHEEFAGEVAAILAPFLLDVGYKIS